MSFAIARILQHKQSSLNYLFQSPMKQQDAGKIKMAENLTDFSLWAGNKIKN